MSKSYSPISTSSSSPPPPTLTTLSANLDYISRAKQRVHSTFASPRPWRHLLNIRHVLSRPCSFPESLTRLRSNLSYFRVNFAILVLFTLFLSLLWHPISLIVFVATMGAWLSLFFLRDEPLVVFGHIIDDRLVLAVLAALTVLFLLLTSVTVNVLVSLAVGIGIVVVYSVLRRVDDLFVDEEAAAAGGLVERRPAGIDS